MIRKFGLVCFYPLYNSPLSNWQRSHMRFDKTSTLIYLAKLFNVAILVVGFYCAPIVPLIGSISGSTVMSLLNDESINSNRLWMNCAISRVMTDWPSRFSSFFSGYQFFCPLVRCVQKWSDPCIRSRVVQYRELHRHRGQACRQWIFLLSLQFQILLLSLFLFFSYSISFQVDIHIPSFI